MHNHRGIDEKSRGAIGARLAHALKTHHRHKDLNNNEFAKRLGVSGTTAGNWLNGKKLPGVEHCIQLAHLLEISLDWLLLNKGEMRPDRVRQEAVYVGAWPDPAKSVVRGLAEIYGDAKHGK